MLVLHYGYNHLCIVIYLIKDKVKLVTWKGRRQCSVLSCFTSTWWKTQLYKKYISILAKVCGQLTMTTRFFVDHSFPKPWALMCIFLPIFADITASTLLGRHSTRFWTMVAWNLCAFSHMSEKTCRSLWTSLCAKRLCHTETSWASYF